MEFDKDYNVVVKKFEALDNLYVAWVNKVIAARVAPAELRERLAKEAAETFEEFCREFEMSLPEMAFTMYRDFSQTMEIDIRGVPKETVVRMIERAKEHKIGSILDAGSLTFCALPRQEADPDLKLLDEADQPQSPDLQPEQSEQPVARPTRNLLKDFRFRPDPIEAVSLVEVLPEEDTLVFEIEQPESFGSPITAIHADIEQTFTDRSVVNQQAVLTSFSPARLRVERLPQLRQLVMTLRPQNASGLQIKSRAWKYLFPVQHARVSMLGRNDFCQVDSELVSEERRLAIEASAAQDYYCSGWAELRPSQPSLQLVKAVSRDTSLGVTRGCRLLQWGLHRRLEAGQVLEEPTHHFAHPRLLVQQVGLGDTFAAAVTVEGRVFAWGDNRAGQLGLGYFCQLVEKPTLVSGLAESFVVDLRCGSGHSICLDDGGVAYSWGQNQAVAGKPVLNRFGEQIGFSNSGVHQPQPFPISRKTLGSEERVCQVASGEFNLGLVTSKGELFLWGDNAEDLLGDFPAVHSAVPIKIGLPFPAKKVHIGFDHSVVETADADGHQRFFAWGSNLEGQCGQKPGDPVKAPAELKGLPGSVGHFWCGMNRSFFVDGQQRVWAVGQGLLGLFESSAQPVCTAALACEVFEFNGTVTATAN